MSTTPKDDAPLARAALLLRGTQGAVWTDDTTPRTERPVRFSRSCRPLLALSKSVVNYGICDDVPEDE